MLYLPIISKAITVFYLQSVWLNNGKHVFKSSIILHTYLSAWFEAKGCLLVTNFSQFFRALWCCFLDVGGSGCGSNIRLFYFPFWMVESGWIWYESKLLSVFPTQTHLYSKFYQLHAMIWNSNLSDVIFNHQWSELLKLVTLKSIFFGCSKCCQFFWSRIKIDILDQCSIELDARKDSHEPTKLNKKDVQNCILFNLLAFFLSSWLRRTFLTLEKWVLKTQGTDVIFYHNTTVFQTLTKIVNLGKQKRFWKGVSNLKWHVLIYLMNLM